MPDWSVKSRNRPGLWSDISDKTRPNFQLHFLGNVTKERLRGTLINTQFCFASNLIILCSIYWDGYYDFKCPGRYI